MYGEPRWQETQVESTSQLMFNAIAFGKSDKILPLGLMVCEEPLTQIQSLKETNCFWNRTLKKKNSLHKSVAVDKAVLTESDGLPLPGMLRVYSLKEKNT